MATLDDVLVRLRVRPPFGLLGSCEVAWENGIGVSSKILVGCLNVLISIDLFESVGLNYQRKIMKGFGGSLDILQRIA